MLGAGAAELLLGSVADSGEYVQTEEAVTPQVSENLQVSNVAPANVELFLDTDEIFENDVVRLAVTFEDLDVDDTHIATIDWGDGTAVEVIEIDPGADFLATSHQYLDDNPTATSMDVNTIKVQVFDAAGECASAETLLTVKNTAPTIEGLSVTPMVGENGVAKLQLEFSDPGTQDTHTVEIDWGDGTPTETFTLDPGTEFFATTHQYLDDNPTGTSSDSNTVQAKVLDDDGGIAMAEREVLVKNIGPTIDSLSISSPIDEFQFATLKGTYSDPGTQDTFELDIDWDGDHVFDQTVAVSGGSFEVTRQILDDNPTATPVDTFNVNVRLRDDDTGSAADSVPLTVKNVAPAPSLVRLPGPVDEGGFTNVLLSFFDPGTPDSHTIEIDWGDGTAIETINVPVSGPRIFLLTHVYSDDNPTGTSSDLNQMSVVVTDDDGGQSTAKLPILVRNVSPELTVAEDQVVDEGMLLDFSEGSLGSFTDVGKLDTHTATVNWGDGTATETVAVNQAYGSGTLDASHTYADNGLYTATVTVSDDDGGFVTQSFKIQVNNVAPTLELTDRDLEINEGGTLDLFDLGKFFDPGFDNPLNTNDPSNGGEVVETFSYTIDWGDGIVETGVLPASLTSGSAVEDTIGTLVDSHQYLDNDADNLYTITVTLSDDDGGSITEHITARVLNVNPTLNPVSATNLNSSGETNLTLEFADPGTETLTVWVDWGDQLALPPHLRFVPETVVLGPGTQNLVLQHTYTGPPDPMNPAADIVISVFVRDDDFGMPLVVDPGQSVTQIVAISIPGIGITPEEPVDPVPIDTSPQVPRLISADSEDDVFFGNGSSENEGGLESGDLRAAAGDFKLTTDRFFELRVIDPASGEEGEGHRLKAEVLDDLPGLFRTLPDNRYAIYLVRTETNTHRLVVEVYVRNGKLIDPGDDSEGTRDRPPTDEATEQPKLDVPTEEAPILKSGRPEAQNNNSEGNSAASAWTDPVPAEAAWRLGEQRTRLLLGSTLVGLAASRSGRAWVERIDEAIAAADSRKWRQLRRRYPQRRYLHKRKKG